MRKRRKWYPAPAPLGPLTRDDMSGPSCFSHAGIDLTVKWDGVNFADGRIEPGFKAWLRGHEDWKVIGTGYLHRGAIKTAMFPDDDYFHSKDALTVQESLVFICDRCKREEILLSARAKKVDA